MGLRIGIDAFQFVPGQGRGSGFGTYVINLVRSLARICHDHHLTVFANRYNQHLFPKTVEVTVIPMPPQRSLWPLRIAWQQGILPIVAAAKKIDVVHHPFDYGSLLQGCASVVTLHDLIDFYYAERFPDSPARWRIAYSRAMKSLACRRADLVIAVSEATRREAISKLHLDQAAVVVVPEAPADCFFEEPPHGPLPDGVTEPFILAVTSTSVHKNVTGLVKAYEIARERQGLPHDLVICGLAGQDHDQILKVIRASRASAHIKVLGFVGLVDLRRLYRRADALVFVPFVEGFGLPPLEAMASGTAVVTSNRPPMSDIVGDAGLLVDPEDHEAIALAIVRVCFDEALRRRLEEAGKVRAAHYSWDRTAAMTVEAYERAFKIHRDRRP